MQRSSRSLFLHMVVVGQYGLEKRALHRAADQCVDFWWDQLYKQPSDITASNSVKYLNNISGMLEKSSLICQRDAGPAICDRLDHISWAARVSNTTWTLVILPNNRRSHSVSLSLLSRRWPCRRVCGPGAWRTRRWLSCSAGRILRSSSQTWGRLDMGASEQSTLWVFLLSLCL